MHFIQLHNFFNREIHMTRLLLSAWASASPLPLPPNVASTLASVAMVLKLLLFDQLVRVELC
jgi:hypothetical protein